MVSSGTLFFNSSSSYFKPDKTSVRGKGNQHDESKGVDLKIGEEFIKNGVDNFFPNDIEEVVKRSMLQKRAQITLTNIINGPIVWQNPDGSATTPDRQKFLSELYKSIGITKHDYLGHTIKSNYLQGGSFQTLQFGSDGRAMGLSRVSPRVYKTGRLSFPTWDKVKYTNDKHYYHRNWGYMHQRRNKKTKISRSTKSWMDWNEDPKKNFDEACFIYSWNEDRPLSEEINRLQSVMIGDFDGLSDHYPTPVWYSATTYNYEQAEFELSCFDIDDIQNAFHASGIVKVYHESYINPESGEAKQTFEKHQQMIEDKLKHSYNSGAVVVVPVGIDAEGKITPTNDSIEFEPFKTSGTKDRHDNFDKRIINKVLGANGVIMPELLGIRDEKSTLSESGDKLINAIKILLQFTIEPQKELLDDKDSGFLNAIVNPLLGVEEQAVIIPNMSAFLKVSDEAAKHFLHPEQWYKTMRAFGLNEPTIEQIESGLIPAYRKSGGGNMNRVTIE